MNWNIDRITKRVCDRKGGRTLFTRFSSGITQAAKTMFDNNPRRRVFNVFIPYAGGLGGTWCLGLKKDGSFTYKPAFGNPLDHPRGGLKIHKIDAEIVERNGQFEFIVFPKPRNKPLGKDMRSPNPRRYRLNQQQPNIPRKGGIIKLVPHQVQPKKEPK